MTQHKAVLCLALGIQTLIAFLAYWFNQILAHCEGQICFYAGKITHLQGENYEITKEKILGKKELECPSKSFPEGSKVIFALILFSLSPNPKESICNLKTVVSNTNLRKPEQTLTLIWCTP